MFCKEKKTIFSWKWEARKKKYELVHPFHSSFTRVLRFVSEL
jgi:hypothetical protein